ncbi:MULTISPECIES: GTP 3',8-cyclase MoaA [unclassified Clostridium]|jgi:molybdenum cofactor biosynthesis protein A|uniref:GTP 3',8-cyclase MoaA n=1 Tax=unclassified Clostridium TaxID=2614128 RepID=UPI0025BA5834|nr:GTP 3',8-cyclase MoaA [Clostridium sp.]MDY2631162.1 GTP 3',8-cyclase MoaA [Clostridium sp.]MDY4252262.1 GTP 3',8-cyclase MoaA [Clostridium sp.]
MKDKYGREIDYLRISLTDKCNLRCIYCMEEKGNDFFDEEEKVTKDEICKIVNSCSKLGIKKIRLTGGEPLVRKDIVELVEAINKIEGIEEIYLTTNGILLEDKVYILKKAGLKGVNISLDSLKDEMFNKLTRLGELKKVLKSIDKCLEHGINVKLNVVMIKGMNEDEILDFVKLTLDKSMDVRFIELMPIGVGSKFKGVSNEEIKKIIKDNYNDTEEVMKNKNGGPATYIKLRDAKGKVGFISAISNCFCEECNRIRLTSEGFLKQCLHYNYGIDLKKLLRNGASEEEIINAIEENIFNKPEKHLFMKKSADKELKFMNKIGG